MATAGRSRDRGTIKGEASLRTLASEFRAARLALGLSQQVVADAVNVNRAIYSLVERAKLERFSVMLAARMAAVLGLDLFVALYPGPRAIRDKGSAERIKQFLAHVGLPLRARTEVPLPRTGDRPEQRSWDVMLVGLGERTGIELEMRLYDVQAQVRRHNLKRRDDPVDHFLLVVADTRRNRVVVGEYADLFADLPRLRTANVLKLLRAGRHPPTGFILL